MSIQVLAINATYLVKLVGCPYLVELGDGIEGIPEKPDKLEAR